MQKKGMAGTRTKRWTGEMEERAEKRTEGEGRWKAKRKGLARNRKKKGRD